MCPHYIAGDLLPGLRGGAALDLQACNANPNYLRASVKTPLNLQIQNRQDGGS
jgi:hypothetical protein